ncbi:hypothetical protein [Nocardioides humi]|uniref:HYR domain-containing protein n=1 Tax=Nocardioides humi TaxID=449461 RepID=A0ABN2A689_9ACTN|nr:hypothetical protein [Nocardioides humi]
MRHSRRVKLAAVASLGLSLSGLAIAAPATAGQMNTSTFDTTTLSGSGPQSGTLPNGVEWSVDKGAGPSDQGYYVYPSDGVQTYTFSEPVSLAFGISGLNCAGEAVRLQDGIEPVDVNAHHVWDGDDNLLTGSGASTGDVTTFTSTAPVTSFTLTPVGAGSCGRGVSSFEVGYFDNQTPTATIAAPVDGGEFTQGQTVAADYSCADGDTGHVDAVDCVGDVAVGEPIDTSTTGTKTFTVTATDEHGASSTQTVSYTVTDQAGLCAGIAVGLPLNINLGTANAGGVPCATDSGTLLDATVSLGALPFPLTALSPSVTVKAVDATSEKAGSTHRADAKVDYVKIAFPLNGYVLELKDLWSEASASTPVNCAAGNELNGVAEIGQFTQNGVVHNQQNKPVSIPLPLLGGVYLNQVVKTGSTVVTNAVAIDLPGQLLDVTIGSAIAGVDC